jgi:DNA mismatch repair protein MutL
VLFTDLLSLMACHAAVRAGDRLTAEEIADLVEQRHLADDTHHCPHGRPTALLFSKQDLDRQFRRI